MAAAPRCKVCGTAHWANQPHAFTNPTLAMPAPAEPRPVENPHLPADYKARLEAVLAEQAAGRAKRAAYMREYRARKGAT